MKESRRYTIDDLPAWAKDFFAQERAVAKMWQKRCEQYAEIESLREARLQNEMPEDRTSNIAYLHHAATETMYAVTCRAAYEATGTGNRGTTCILSAIVDLLIALERIDAQ